MEKILSHNLTKFSIVLLFGVFIGWTSNNYYYANFYEPSDELLALFEEDDEGYLQRVFPVSCSASSQLNENQSCENLFDLNSDGWEDNNLNCKEQWIEFDLGEEYFVEFIVMQNYQYEGLYAQKDKIRDFTLEMNNENEYSDTMIDSTDSQWFDINEDASTIRMKVISSWNTVGTETCHLQEFEIYGRSKT
jgi:hypothetical protein